MSKMYLLVVFLTVFSFGMLGQSKEFIPLDLPTQNLIKFNRYLSNPTFSIIGEKSSKISLYNRRQWIDFDGSPEAYMLNYSGLISENVGVGLNAYQQNSGVLKNFGVIANYAYRFKFSDNIAVTFGVNAAYLISGLNRSKIFGDPDPALEALDNNSIFMCMPGGNISFGRFDLGVYAENFIDYSIKTGETLTEFKDKSFTSHIMYTQPFSVPTGIFKDAALQIMVKSRKTPDRGYVMSGSLLLDLPKAGWVQGGYNKFYGYSVGLGVNVSKHISFGYVLEKGMSRDIKNFGNTHEITMAYTFDPRKKKETQEEKDDSKKTLDAVEEKDGEKSKKTVEELETDKASSNSESSEAIRKEEALEKAKENRASKIVQNRAISPNTHDANGVQYQYLGVVPGVKNGYYVTTKVFNNEILAKNEVAALKANGHKVSYFKNSNNGYFYVYLDRYLSWDKVKKIVKSNYNDTYVGDLLIMDVAVEKNPVKIAAPKKRKVINKKPRITRRKTTNTSDNTSDNTSEDEIRSSYANKTKKPRRIAQKVTLHIDDVASGYYLIASVFSVKSNADRFIDKLKEQGLDARYFINPKNKYRYVYLQYSEEKAETLKAYYSNVNDTYFDEIWVMHVLSHNKRKPRVKPQMVLTTTDVPSGFYIIVGVYSKERNATRFLNKLKNDGLDANYFVNPKNKYRYIYLVHSESKRLVSSSYYSNIDNTYFGEKWIMAIKKR